MEEVLSQVLSKGVDKVENDNQVFMIQTATSGD